MSFDENNLDKCLGELENKTKKLNFCKSILKSESIFSVKTEEVDEEVVKEVESLIKDKIKKYTEEIITENAVASERVLDNQEWAVLKEMLNRALKRDTVQKTISGHSNEAVVGPKNVETSAPITTEEDVNNGVSLITSIHAILESSGISKQDIPLNTPMKVIEQDKDYVRCSHDIYTPDGQSREVIFRVPKDDVEYLNNNK